MRQHQVVRVRDAIRRRGVADTAGDAFQRGLRLHEAHIWYELDLRRERRGSEMPSGLQLVEASADQLWLVERLPSLTVDQGAQSHGRLREPLIGAR